MKTRTLCWLVVLGLVAARAEAGEDPVVNVYNWSDYVAEDTIERFEKRSGIKVNYDVFDSNEVLEAKLLTGSSGYDVVVPSGSFLERQIAAGVYRRLDRSKLANYGHLDERMLELVARHDPGNLYSVPYLWGTTGFGYDAVEVAKHMPDAPTESWDMLFDPKVAQKLGACGITLLDSPNDAYASAMIYLGRDPNSEDPKDLADFEKLLMKVRPHIKYFHSSQYINDLANGEICVAMGWGGDLLQARRRAIEAGTGVDIRYVNPKEGGLIQFDQLAVPADAPHPDNAHAFIDYLMEPEVTAALTNYVKFPSSNESALPLVDAHIRNDPGIHPPDEVMVRLHPDQAESPKFARLLTRSWTRIKTGR
jgi:putrescine transport system substrate-binding protein